MNSEPRALQFSPLLLDVAPGVVALVGAGGKTTLMFRLARELENAGESVLTCTTTKIFRPHPRQSRHVIISADPDEIIRKAKQLGPDVLHITAGAGYVGGNRKLSGLHPLTIQRVWESGLFRWILIEADGAARRPLKAPAPHEPVFPIYSQKIIALVGLHALGKPLNVKWVFRPEIYSQCSGTPLNAPVTPQSAAAVLLHPQGILKGRLKDNCCDLFLNQADNQSALEAGHEIAAHLFQEKRDRFHHIWIGSLKPPLFLKSL